MKRVVGLMHRQAVKAKAEGLFFKVRFSMCFFCWVSGFLGCFCFSGLFRSVLALALVFSGMLFCSSSLA